MVNARGFSAIASAGKSTDMATIAVAVAALVILLLVSRWHDFSSKELGYMSAKWLAEYNAQHP